VEVVRRKSCDEAEEERDGCDILGKKLLSTEI